MKTACGVSIDNWWTTVRGREVSVLFLLLGRRGIYSFNQIACRIITINCRWCRLAGWLIADCFVSKLLASAPLFPLEKKKPTQFHLHHDHTPQHHSRRNYKSMLICTERNKYTKTNCSVFTKLLGNNSQLGTLLVIII